MQVKPTSPLCPDREVFEINADSPLPGAAPKGSRNARHPIATEPFDLWPPTSTPTVTHARGLDPVAPSLTGTASDDAKADSGIEGVEVSLPLYRIVRDRDPRTKTNALRKDTDGDGRIDSRDASPRYPHLRDLRYSFVDGDGGPRRQIR